MKATYIVIIAIAICTILFHLAAKANEREDHQTINNILHNHDREDTAKGILLGAVIACRLNAVRAALFEGRWWTWCGEPKPEPMPDTGPVLNDVTPSAIIEAK